MWLWLFPDDINWRMGNFALQAHYKVYTIEAAGWNSKEIASKHSKGSNKIETLPFHQQVPHSGGLIYFTWSF